MIIMDNRATTTGVVATAVLLAAALTCTFAEMFTVGGDMEWIVPVPNSGLNYTVWAQNITARVGDSLYFKYNPNAHDVLKVDSAVYAACNTSVYLQIWDTGDTTVVLQETGTHYFICGASEHCVMGQAFALDVLPAPTDVGPSGPTAAGVLSPPGPSAAPATHVGRSCNWALIFVSMVVLVSRL